MSSSNIVLVSCSMMMIVQIVTSFVVQPLVPFVRPTAVVLSSSSVDNDFAAFAQSLEEEEEIFASSTSTTSMIAEEPWQAKLETLLDPRTSLAKRQILASELAAANEDIRDSVLTAVKDRKIDPLLTPTGKRLQDGTRAVARQLTNDILPKVLENNPIVVRDNDSLSSSSSSSSSMLKPPPPPEQVLSALPKIGERLFRTFQSQAVKQFQELQDDLSDPFTKIPQRLSQQSQFVQTEVGNVFLETPEGLEGPNYEVVRSTEDYEIRDYESYTVASTLCNNNNDDDEDDGVFSLDDVANSGAAFNTLASYLFGANSEERAMEMTTPVTMTSLGEMRFYLKPNGAMTTAAFPEPLSDDATATNAATTTDSSKVTLMTIPASRLAVRRFTGFVTDGEVSRQKQVLLQSLELDGEELDVAHGAIVPHVIFQYNPPYTLPVVRRNEVAIPLVMESTITSSMEEEEEEQQQQLSATEEEEEEDTDDNYEDSSPSDY